MEVGNEREEESRSYYEMRENVDVEKVGLIYKDEEKKFLCSPDGVINREYGLELKNVIPKTQVGRLLDNKLPTEYFSQVQSSLYVTGFEFWVFVSYVPKMKPLVIRVERDEKFIKAFDKELKIFNEELDKITEEIR